MVRARVTTRDRPLEAAFEVASDVDIGRRRGGRRDAVIGVALQGGKLSMSTAAAQTYKRGNPAQGLHLQEVDAAFATALAVNGPSLVEIVTDPELV